MYVLGTTCRLVSAAVGAHMAWIMVEKEL